jgi:hypothetical protein
VFVHGEDHSNPAIVRFVIYINAML